MNHPTEKSLNEKYSYMELPYFEFEEGWNTLLSNLLKELAKIDKNKKIRVDQIKEKYASIRFYYHPYTKKIQNLITKYEKISAKTCEICGEKGHLRVLNNHSWYKTLCDKHAEELDYKDVPKK